MQVSLRPVTRENYEAVCDLHIPDEQQQFLSPNVYSLLESHYYPETHRPRAIYDGETLVGFIMWSVFTDDSGETEALIFRFMVAHEHQRKGIGRQSLLATVEEIESLKSVDSVVICYSPENDVSAKLYASVGFVEKGMADDGEDMLAVLEFTSDSR